jgi:hypothetical protein
VVKRSAKIMLPFCLADVLSLVAFLLPLLAILRKKVGEPKEEIRNLYGFYMNSSNVNSYV